MLRRFRGAVAPDGIAAVMLATGAFLLGGFLPTALGAISVLAAQILSGVGGVLVIATIVGRARQSAVDGDCLILAAPLERWSSTERVVNMTRLIAGAFRRYWTVPRQLPNDPRNWSSGVADLRGWIRLTLAQRQGDGEAGPLSVMLFMPEQVAWKVGNDFAGRSLVVQQERLNRSSFFVSCALSAELTPLSAGPSLVSSAQLPAHGTGPDSAIILDLGRDRGLAAEAAEDAASLGAAEICLIAGTSPTRVIPESRDAFSQVVHDCSEAVQLVRSRIPVDGKLYVYLNTPVSIAFALGYLHATDDRIMIMQRVAHGEKFARVA